MKKPFVLLLVLFFLPSALSAAYSPQGYVSDYADIITPEWETQISSLASEIQSSTTAEVAVLTIPSLEGGDINQFAVETLKDWGIGKKGINQMYITLLFLKILR